MGERKFSPSFIPMDNSRITRDKLREVVQNVMLRITDPYDPLCGSMLSTTPEVIADKLTQIAKEETTSIEDGEIVFKYNPNRDVINYELIINKVLWETSTFYIY